MDILIGESGPADAGTIEVDGQSVDHLGPQARRERGMAFVPEDRLGHGAVPGLSLEENVLLSQRSVSPLGMIDWSGARARAENIVAAFDVRTPGTRTAARSLSGGNLQKFIMGREILTHPGVLIVSQPTWGVDAGAASAIQSALLALAQSGAAVVVISQDLDELFQIASRIAVIAGGRLTPARAIGDVTTESIGRAMGGAHPHAGGTHA